MKLPRITLPWRTLRRNPDAAPRHDRHRGAHRAERATRLPGRRATVGGAMTILALTTTTATAVGGGPADHSAGSAEPVPVTTSAAASRGAADQVVVVSTDPTVIDATSALDRAQEADEHAKPAVAEKLDDQVEKVAELLTERRDVGGAASRSGERDTVAESAQETAESAQETPESAQQARTTTTDLTDAAADLTDLAGVPPLPDPAAIFPARTQDRPATTDAAADGATVVAEAAAVAATTKAETKELAKATKSLEALIEKAESATVEVTSAAEKAEAEAAAKKKKAAEAKKKAAAKVAATPKTPGGVLRAQVRAAKNAAAKLAKHVDSTAGDENGRISADALSTLKFDAKEQLRTDAARQLERLNTAYKARFGTNLKINDTYRSYEDQVAMKASKGHLAAVPGYSNHGWGVAVDLGGGVESFGTAQYEWLREHGPKFGWDNPGWARSDGRKPEAWHWEYTGL